MSDLTDAQLLIGAKELPHKLGWSVHKKVILSEIALPEDLLHVMHTPSSYLRGKNLGVFLSQAITIDTPVRPSSFCRIKLIRETLVLYLSQAV